MDFWSNQNLKHTFLPSFSYQSRTIPKHIIGGCMGPQRTLNTSADTRVGSRWRNNWKSDKPKRTASYGAIRVVTNIDHYQPTEGDETKNRRNVARSWVSYARNLLTVKSISDSRNFGQHILWWLHLPITTSTNETEQDEKCSVNLKQILRN